MEECLGACGDDLNRLGIRSRLKFRMRMKRRCG